MIDQRAAVSYERQFANRKCLEHDITIIISKSLLPSIAFEADFLIESAQSFKTETIPELQQELENSGNSTAVLQDAGPILDLSIANATTAKELVNSGAIYDAALSLDEANKNYASIIESEEMSALLGLDEEEEPEQ